MESNIRGRDGDIIQSMLEEQDPETAGKIKAFLAKIDTAEQQDIRAIMALLEKNGISSAKFVKPKMPEVKPCSSMVCSLMACVASSSCKNGACSDRACSANTGGIIPPSNPVDCKNASTCGTEACYQNAGTTYCKTQFCASLAK